MRTQHHTSPGLVNASVRGASPVTVHADPATTTAYVELAPVAAGDNIAADRIRRAAITSEGTHFRIALPEDTTSTSRNTVGASGNATVVQSNGSICITQHDVPAGAEMVGVHMGAGGTVVGGNTVVQQTGGAVRIDLHVPAGSDFEAHNHGSVTAHGSYTNVGARPQGGDVHIDRVAMRAELRTQGGNVVLDQAHGLIEAMSQGGNIRVGAAEAGGSLKSQGGNIRAELAGPHALECRSQGGNVRVTTVDPSYAHDVSARAQGGDVRIN